MKRTVVIAPVDVAAPVALGTVTKDINIETLMILKQVVDNQISIYNALKCWSNGDASLDVYNSAIYQFNQHSQSIQLLIDQLTKGHRYDHDKTEPADQDRANGKNSQPLSTVI